MPRNKENALLIFVKHPVPGEVKTRLCPELTPERAAAFYRTLVEDTLEVHLNSAGHETIVCFTPEHSRDEVRSWLGEDITLQGQRGGDLGSRQFDAIGQALEAGYRKAVIIGSDCPAITPGDIETAFDLLDDNQLVIGPSEDGGYYLIGAAGDVECVFENISWGGEEVLRETMERAREAGVTFGMLDIKYDIDTYHDLKRYYRSVKEGTICAFGKRSLRVMDSLFDGEG